jgi:hypothetical protein
VNHSVEKNIPHQAGTENPIFKIEAANRIRSTNFDSQFPLANKEREREETRICLVMDSHK